MRLQSSFHVTDQAELCFKNRDISKPIITQIKHFLTDIRLIISQILSLFETVCPNFCAQAHLSTYTEELPALTDEIFSGHFPKGTIPELWDGKTAVRIVNNIHILK